MSDSHYVVVTVVSHGPIHVYSDTEPMTKERAKTLAEEIKQGDVEKYPDHPAELLILVRPVLAKDYVAGLWNR